MIGAAVLIAIGIIAGQFFPNQFRERVRALAGKARDAAFGSRPASKVSMGISPNIPMGNATGGPIESPIEVRPSLPNKPIEAVKGFLAGVGNMAAFVVKHPVLLIGLALVAFWLIAGSSCARLPFGKSADTLRAERDAERINSAVAKNERDVAAFALEIAERTHARTNAANQAVIEGQQELADVVANLPPMVGQEHFADLQRRYADAYERVLRAAGFEGEPDPSPPRSEPMRRPATDPV